MLQRFSIILFSLAIIIGVVCGVRDLAFITTQSRLASISTVRSDVLSLTPPANKKVSIVFVGDIMLARTVGNKIAASSDPLLPFQAVLPFLRESDITFGNLESVISNKGSNVGSIYSFRADPRTLSGLVDAGFDIVSVANNHAFDWGRPAFSDSISRLTQAGIRPVGGGALYDEANTAVILERNGIRFGWYAYTNLLPQTLRATQKSAGLSAFDEELVFERIRNEKNTYQLDYVIVSMHWGDEYATEANAMQKRIAHGLVDAGADIVIGHHPHVVQEVEWYKGKYIAYSLGNFVFDQYFSENTMRGLVVCLTCDEKGIVRAEHFSSVLNTSYQVERLDSTTPVFIQ